MNTGIVVLMGSVLAVSLVLPTSGWATVVPQTAQDHLNMVQAYQEKAKLEREVIADRTKMKEDYGKQVATSPKFESSLVKKMQRHCDAIIKKAGSLAREYERFAEWHSMRAKELEGY